MSQGKDPTVNSTAPMQQSQGGDKEKTEIVSCWAKFRPWEDWRGEYGFDWLREGPDDYKEENSVGSTSPFDDLVQEDNPFEYLYPAEFVRLVYYEMSKAKNNGAWTYSYELIGDEIGNGDGAALACKEESDRMYSFVELKDSKSERRKISLISSGNDVFFPIYNVKICKENQNRTNRDGNPLDKKISFEFNECLFSIEYSYSLHSPIPVIFAGTLDFKFSPVPVKIHVSITKTCVAKSTPKEENKKKSKKQHKKKEAPQPEAAPTMTQRTVLYDYDFEDHKIKLSSICMDYVKNEREQIVDLEAKPDYSDADQFWKECTANDEGLFDELFNNFDAIDIAKLASYKSLDNISIMVNGPTSLNKQCQLTDGIKDEGETKEWYGNPILTWKEGLENSFHIKKILLKDKDGNIVNDPKTKKPKRYFIPVLSVGGFTDEMTSFSFRWGDKWTPKTKSFDPEKGIPIQVNVEGDLPDEITYKVRLTAKENSALGKFYTMFTGKDLEINTSDINPDDVLTVEAGKAKKEYTIKLFPKVNKNAFSQALEKMEKRTHDSSGRIDKCQARVVAIGTKDGKSQEIGELQVDLLKIKILTVWFVQVQFNGVAFDSDYVKAIKEQEQALRNAMYQAGIKLDARCVKMDHPAFVKKDGTAEFAVFDAFTKKFNYNPIYQYAIFFLPMSFGNVIAVNHGGNQVWFSNYILKDRRRAYTSAHELGHALHLTHSFQSHSPLGINPFCFEFCKTSNIMDYKFDTIVKNGIDYSLRKYQWEIMRKFLEN